MATVTKEFIIAADPDTVWDALRDFHAVHERVAPGFLTSATREGDDRVLTFFNGIMARERLIGCDEATRRIAYSIVEGRFAYHHASFQVHPDKAGSRVVWITDLLPDSLADTSSMMMDQGGAAMVRTLARRRDE
ncbi:MAG TPA: SRPBCC family protein [Acetobacteraceae bacterium]|jgi:carbon monoxide dehydrogenase subunit G